MKYSHRSILIIFFFLLSFAPFIDGHEIQKEFTFSNSDHGWVGEFADYPVGGENFFELGWGWENLPIAIEFPGENLTKGLFLTGNNHSDDLFMFIKHQMDGLRPNTFYDLTYSILIECNTPSGISIGIGGSPGKNVYFKAGASDTEPKKIAVNDYYLLNIDKGNQSHSGKSALVIGDLESPAPDPYDLVYFPKQLSHEVPLRMQTDPQGRLWLFLGTDSGFEGMTKFYIAKVSLHLNEVEPFVNFMSANEKSLHGCPSSRYK
jgi:hypothetical protein